MSVTFKGSKGPVLLSSEPEYIQGQGWTWREFWRGGQSEIEGLMPSYVGGTFEFEVDSIGPWWTLLARRQAETATGTQGFTDRFLFKKETIERDIYSYEPVQEEAESFSSLGMLEYRALIEDVVNDESENYSETILNSSQFDPYPLMRKVLIERTRGAAAFEDEYLTMKRTRVVGLLYQPKLAIKSASIIYSEADLFNVFALPAFVAVTFPPQPAYTPPDTMWGWRSRVQKVQFIEGQKIHVEQDWALAHWSTNHYEAFA